MQLDEDKPPMIAADVLTIFSLLRDIRDEPGLKVGLSRTDNVNRIKLLCA